MITYSMIKALSAIYAIVGFCLFVLMYETFHVTPQNMGQPPVYSRLFMFTIGSLWVIFVPMLIMWYIATKLYVELYWKKTILQKADDMNKEIQKWIDKQGKTKDGNKVQESR